MSANSFGHRFVITSFGESHGKALGAVIDGCPAGVPFDEAALRRDLTRRRPGAAERSGQVLVTARDEADAPEILSGVYEGRTLGTPIAILVRNHDAHSADYKEIIADPLNSPRRGHADDLWRRKFGHSDPRGGGRASGRETVSRVMGGAVAKMFLQQQYPTLLVTGFARDIGPYSLSKAELDALDKTSTEARDVDRFTARFPSEARAAALTELLASAKREGRSYGGVAELWLDGVPVGLGQPVFHKLKSDLAAAMMSVGATSAVELGEGSDAASAEGSSFHAANSDASVYGGVRGGISTGERIVLRVAFKPTSSVLHVAKAGRHDPCIVPRAIPVLEAMACLVLADHALWARGDRVS
jgi:chorismate synthase